MADEAKISQDELAQRFAKHMRERLGVGEVERHVKVWGSVGDRFYDCDLHGIRQSALWGMLQWLSVLVALAGIAGIIFPDYVPAGADQGLGPRAAGMGVAIVGWVAFLLGSSAKKRRAKHIWVECREKGQPIRRADLIALAESSRDVQRREDTEQWKPDELWFVTGSGYDVEAANVAPDLKVRCFDYAEGKFVEL